MTTVYYLCAAIALLCILATTVMDWRHVLIVLVLSTVIIGGVAWIAVAL
jgi:hypothetical protein